MNIKVLPSHFGCNLPLLLYIPFSPFIKESDTETVYLDVEKEYLKKFINSRIHLTEEEKRQILNLVKDEGEFVSHKDSDRIVTFLLDLVGRTFKEDDKLPKKLPFWKSHLEHAKFHENAALRQGRILERMEEAYSCTEILKKTVPKTEM